MMVEDILHHPIWSESEDVEYAAVPILIVFGMMRDDFPWLYELGLQLYRAIESGNLRSIERSRKALINSLEFIRHPFMMEIVGPDDDEMMMMLPHFLRDFLHRLDRLIVKPKGGKKPDIPPSEKGQ